MTLEQRIEKLERSLRIWRSVSLAVGLVFVVWFLSREMPETQAAQKAPVVGVFDSVATKSITLLNADGVAVGGWGVTNGIVKLVVGPEGQPHRAELSAMDKGSSFILYGNQCKTFATATGLSVMDGNLGEYASITRDQFGQGRVYVDGSLEVDGTVRVQSLGRIVLRAGD